MYGDCVGDAAALLARWLQGETDARTKPAHAVIKVKVTKAKPKEDPLKNVKSKLLGTLPPLRVARKGSDSVLNSALWTKLNLRTADVDPATNETRLSLSLTRGASARYFHADQTWVDKK